MTSQSTTPTDTLNISETITRHPAITKALSNTLDISETAVSHVHHLALISDTLNISGATFMAETHQLTDELDISEVVSVGGELVQFDSWRSVPRFDNSLYLLCRTPVGEFDSDEGLADMTVWTVDHDGNNEIVRISLPSDNSWDSYSHPEWSPDGQTVVLAAETASEYQLILIDASEWT